MATAWLENERPSTDNVAHVRVLHLINGEHYAGAERVQDLLGMRLGEWGFDVGFACLKRGAFPDVRRARACPLYALPMSGRFDLRPARKLAHILREEGYALLHTHTARGALVGRLAAAKAGVPMVHHLHSPTARDTTHRLRNWLNVAIERYSLARVAAVVPVSHSLGRYAAQAGMTRGLLRVVPNGVPARGPLAARVAPSSGEGTWTIGCVALFRPRKGLEVLLDALAELKRRGLPVRLRAVGRFETRDYEEQVLRQAQQLGVSADVDWRGFTSEVDRELAAMDVFVLPSLFGEGLPMVVLEAMAAGVPVVGTRVEGVPEAIRHEVDGLIAEPGSAASLADALARIVRGEVSWQALREHAHRRHAEQFSDRSMAAGVAEVYRQVLERAAR